MAKAKANFKNMPLYCGGELCRKEDMPLFYDKNIPLFIGGKPFSNNILRALLDAGANPDKLKFIGKGALSAYHVEEANDTLFIETLGTLSSQKYIAENDVLLERLKILLDHKANTELHGTTFNAFKMVVGMFNEDVVNNNPTEAMFYFLRKRGLEYTSNMTDGNFQSMSIVLKVLYDGGAGTGEAKDYFKKLRQEHRNIPDALKYIDDLEKIIKSSWSLW